MTYQEEGKTPERTIGRQVAGILIDTGCMQFGRFKFASGLRSIMKIEADKLREHPEEHQKVAEILGKLISEKAPDVQILVPVPRGGVSLAWDIYRKSGISFKARPRYENKLKGLALLPDDAAPIGNGSKVVILDDVFTKGTSSLKAIQQVRGESSGTNIQGIAVIYNYGFMDEVEITKYVPADGIYNTKVTIAKVPVLSLCTFNDLIDELQSRPEYSGWIKPLQTWYKLELQRQND